MAEEKKSTEIKSHARKPVIFSGDRKVLEKFLRDCDIFIESNQKDFATPTSRVQFVLSYIDGGEADSWKEHYMNQIIQADGKFIWPSPDDLAKNLRQNFTREDEVEESLRRLETMKQGGRTAEEVVNKFRVLKARAKIDDSPLAVRMFRRVLNPSLAMKILTDPKKVNALENDRNADGTHRKYGWFAKAIQYDQIYRDARAAQQEDRRGSYNDNKNKTFRQAVQKGNERSW